MSTYVIGDVQGCFKSLIALFDLIKFDYKKDEAIFLGDLINRGPMSLEVLRFLIEHEDCLKIVLGNHDIFALAMYYECLESDKPHTLHELLNAPDREALFKWLQEQPIIIDKNDVLFVHAGLFPGFSLDKSLKLAKEVSEILKSKDCRSFLKDCFSKRELTFKNDMPKDALLRLALWANTRMRLCINVYEMDNTFDGTLEKAPNHLTPWFKLLKIDKEVYFGHWAALGLFKYQNFMCLDTGCAWGKKLTALRLQDKKIFQVDNLDLL